MITRISLKNFTVFADFGVTFDPGINIIVGAPGTGKTHLLKVLYAATAVTIGEDREQGFARKLLGVFRPDQGRMGRLVSRQAKGPAEITITRGTGAVLKAVIDGGKARINDVRVSGETKWTEISVESAFIPAHDILAYAPGFLSMTSQRELAFEDVYADVLKRAFLPALKEDQIDPRCKRLLQDIQKTTGGEVVIKGERFFLRNRQGETEFALLSDGVRKFALMGLLIQNGTISPGSVLFLDAPETNLHTSLIGKLVEVLFELYQLEVQIFLVTHNETLLRELSSGCQTANPRIHRLAECSP